MTVQKLYRAVSKAEFYDWNDTKEFRTARNTLEAKQFFKSYKAAVDFHNQSLLLNFDNPYVYIFEVHVFTTCINKLEVNHMSLDTHNALSIEEDR